MYEIGYYDDKQANKIIGLTQLRSEDRTESMVLVQFAIKSTISMDDTKYKAHFLFHFVPKTAILVASHLLQKLLLSIIPIYS